jgi:hypothetical protein
MTLKLSAAHRAMASLQTALRKAPQNPSQDDIKAAERKANLSTKGKIALSTAYTASWPGGMEFRVDPTRDDVKRVIGNGEARLKKADADGNGVLSNKELATVKTHFAQALAAYGKEFE